MKTYHSYFIQNEKGTCHRLRKAQILGVDLTIQRLKIRQRLSIAPISKKHAAN